MGRFWRSVSSWATGVASGSSVVVATGTAVGVGVGTEAGVGIGTGAEVLTVTVTVATPPLVSVVSTVSENDVPTNELRPPATVILASALVDGEIAVLVPAGDRIRHRVIRERAGGRDASHHCPYIRRRRVGRSRRKQRRTSAARTRP